MDKEGDLNVSFPKAPGLGLQAGNGKGKEKEKEDDFGDTVDEEVEMPQDRHDAWRFLLAGGVAGAGGFHPTVIWLCEAPDTGGTVSRTVTAPFDRLKVYLITTQSVYVNPIAARNLSQPVGVASKAFTNLWVAVLRIYGDGGGLKAFWVGNGLNVTKIFPVCFGSHSLRMKCDSRNSFRNPRSSSCRTSNPRSSWQSIGTKCRTLRTSRPRQDFSPAGSAGSRANCRSMVWKRSRHGYRVTSDRHRG